MYEWLLILSSYNGGISVTHVPDKQSCERAARVAQQSTKGSEYSINSGCVQITKTKETH